MSVSVSILSFKEQLNMAECELSAFFVAVEALFGSEQANLSAEDWLDAAQNVLDLNHSTTTRSDWRTITIIASSRLAHRMAA